MDNNGVIKNVAVINTGALVTATERAKQFHLTKGKKYIVLGYDGDILIENDLGNKEYYSKEYFEEYQELYNRY